MKASASSAAMIETLCDALPGTGSKGQTYKAGENQNFIIDMFFHKSRIRIKNYFLWAIANGISFTRCALCGMVKVNRASGKLGFTCQSESTASYCGFIG